VNEQVAEQALRQFGTESGLTTLINEYAWLAVVGFALLFLKESIQNLIAGLALSIGTDYDESDVVWLQTNGTRRPARITRLGLLSTTFYLYDLEVDDNGNKKITGGTLMKLPNAQLPSLRIERPLDKLPLNEND
tara:strand:+ start:264 stop:665 length:402 start_codon:yes stop_codon:yes gene_type:complete